MNVEIRVFFHWYLVAGGGFCSQRTWQNDAHISSVCITVFLCFVCEQIDAKR